ncbi:hypothetical protein [Streptomyces sp. PT12]|uniref:hypothetical protein n=1 Tax=Streptomyces sp. PT12 TaxID=1510197 RepID=UPI000DE45D01|nr:hypothetical protein [Streptomyces sp. PT12]RBM19676.1 hypothetical protein DEH69_09210 [Streptomyces sp. PT12]
MDTDTGRAQLELYVEALRSRLAPDQFIVLMRAFTACRGGGSALAPGLPLTAQEQELFTPEVQSEMLTLMAIGMDTIRRPLERAEP